MKGPNGRKGPISKSRRRGPRARLQGLPPPDHPRRPERDTSAGEDIWDDWFEIENRWRDNINPSNND